MHRNRWNSKNNDTSQNRNDQRKKRHRCINHPSAVFTSTDKDREKYAMRDGCTHNTKNIEKLIRIHQTPMPAEQAGSSAAGLPSTIPCCLSIYSVDYYPGAFNFQYLEVKASISFFPSSNEITEEEGTDTSPENVQSDTMNVAL